MNVSTGIRRVALLALALVAASTFVGAQSRSDRHDTQIWNDTQLAIGLSKKVDFVLTGTLRIGREVERPVDERAGLGFSIKAGKYLTFAPAYYYIAMQPL